MLTGKKDTGDIVTAFMSALIAAQSVEQVLPQLIILERGRAAGGILRAILSSVKQGSRARKTRAAQKLEQIEGNMEIKDVRFPYP